MSDVWTLALTTFLASMVEMVEAMTIVLAMGFTRGWRSTLGGAAAALVVLAVFTYAAGYSLATWLPRSALQLGVGALMLVFGLQWLRKAVLRSAGIKALHDEEAVFDKATSSGRDAVSTSWLGLDWFGFVVSFKGVFLEGLEVVFIVLTFGLSAGHLPVAVAGACVAALVVVVAAALARGPLTRVPENTVKYTVGLLLTTFGTFWAIEGLGVLGPGGGSLEWPGGELAVPALLLAWLVVSRLLVRGLRPSTPGRTEVGVG